MGTYSGSLAWRIPGMAEAGGLPFMGCHVSGHDSRDAAAAAVSSQNTFLSDERCEMLVPFCSVLLICHNFDIKSGGPS